MKDNNSNPDQQLKEITQDIREKLPRLMELSDGCIVDTERSSAKILTILPEETEKNNLYWIVYDPDRVRSIDSRSVESNKFNSYKIIGHEPMLNDVLEWHSKYYSKYSHFEVSNGIGKFICYDSEETYEIIVDLSKPYLKDQSAELIDFLYNLKK